MDGRERQGQVPGIRPTRRVQGFEGARRDRWMGPPRQRPRDRDTYPRGTLEGEPIEQDAAGPRVARP